MKHLIIIAAALSTFSDAANILGVFPFPSESHHILGSALMSNLAKRGHNVTYITPFKMRHSAAGVTTLVIDELVTYKEEYLQKYFGDNGTLLDKIDQMKAINGMQYAFLSSPKIQWFLNSDSKFDLMIHFLGVDASIALGHHFDVPMILFAPIGAISFIGDRFGNPHFASYVPNPFLPYSDEMDFWERLKNALVEVIIIAVKSIIQSAVNNVIHEYFPDAPLYSEIQKRFQLGFVNSHISTETPRPYVPAIVQIGGFHLQEPELLPQDIKKILDDAPNGVIYLSFGTNVKISHMSNKKRDIMMTSLGNIPMKVLMKSDVDTIENKPDNVEIRSWFPQRGILSHPNVKLFISHGGYGGATETLFYGVPMICIPFFADQYQNCASAEHDGYGINLGNGEFTSELFDAALQKALYDKTFIAKAKLKSELYRDQEMNPMDRAAYWVDHVIKHKGAKHLRIKALDLAWYQYYLVDVIGFILLVILFVAVILFYILRCCLRMLCGRKEKLKTH